MNEAQTRRWLTLLEEDEAATSTKFVKDLNWLDVSRYVLQQNFTDAVQIPNAIEQSIEFALEANQQQASILHREFVRRLHNYLAAVKTVVDHMRAFRSHWADESVAGIFQERLDVLTAEPVIHFVQNLRRPVQHFRLPPVLRVTTVQPESPTIRTRLMVRTAELLDLCDWRRQAREYIDRSSEGGNIDMTQPLKEYHQLVVAFDDRGIEEIKARQKHLLDDFDRRRAEIRQLQASP